jgi:CheY-like chemotaxis protein
LGVHSALVVDDAPMIVKMTSMLLKRKGHTVDSAVNGAEAWRSCCRATSAPRVKRHPQQASERKKTKLK